MINVLLFTSFFFAFYSDIKLKLIFCKISKGTTDYLKTYTPLHLSLCKSKVNYILWTCSDTKFFLAYHKKIKF